MEKINNLVISDNSKKVYLSVLKRLEKHDFDITKKVNMKKVTKLLNNFDKVSSKLDLLNLIIVIGITDDDIMNDLKTLRKELQHNRLDKNIQTMNDKGKTLMKYSDFENKLNELFDQKKYKAYILNYLMVTYGLRNLDLDINVCHKKCDDIDDKKNYLI